MEEASVTPESPKNKTNSLTIAAIVVLALGLVLYYSSSKKTVMKKESATEETTPSQMTVTDSSYKDGTYSAVGSYKSPAGDESIQVKLTLKDNLVSEIDVIGNATNPMSIKKQKEFTDGYKVLVVGKNIKDLKLDKVSGSSLTPKGFNDAIEKVKSAAKV